MRIPVEAFGGQSHAAQQFGRLLPPVTGRQWRMNGQRLCHEFLDGQPRVKAGIGILEDHLHMPAQGPHRLLRQRNDVATLDANFPARRRNEFEDGTANGGFSWSPLPSSGFPTGQSEPDGVRDRGQLCGLMCLGTAWRQSDGVDVSPECEIGPSLCNAQQIQRHFHQMIVTPHAGFTSRHPLPGRHGVPAIWAVVH